MPGKRGRPRKENNLTKYIGLRIDFSHMRMLIHLVNEDKCSYSDVFRTALEKYYELKTSK